MADGEQFRLEVVQRLSTIETKVDTLGRRLDIQNGRLAAVETRVGIQAYSLGSLTGIAQYIKDNLTALAVLALGAYLLKRFGL